MTFAFESMESFIHMGGYAAFVWLAYAFVGAGLLAIPLSLRRKQKQLLSRYRSEDAPRS